MDSSSTVICIPDAIIRQIVGRRLQNFIEFKLPFF